MGLTSSSLNSEAWEALVDHLDSLAVRDLPVSALRRVLNPLGPAAIGASDPTSFDIIVPVGLGLWTIADRPIHIIGGHDQGGVLQEGADQSYLMINFIEK